MKRYMLVEFDPEEMPDKMCPEGLVTAIYHVGVRAAEVTDIVTIREVHGRTYISTTDNLGRKIDLQ